MPQKPFTKESISKFVEIWANEFNEYITEEQAVIEMTRFLELCRIAARPLPTETEVDELTDRAEGEETSDMNA